ncbi:hypothetical protein BQ6471_03299 [Vibrio gazogenes]|nr:hypothetical protein BQ6471_03299 [Vibrio gazogenes]
MAANGKAVMTHAYSESLIMLASSIDQIKGASIQIATALRNSLVFVRILDSRRSRLMALRIS